MFGIKLFALQLVFSSCLAAYLSSEQQLLSPSALPKPLGWGAFGLGSAGSLMLLATAYDGPTAVAYWLAAVMVSWMLLVLGSPHLPGKSQVVAWGVGLMLAAAVLG